MDAIPEDKMLRYSSDTMQALQRLYNLGKPGDMDFAITALQDWLKKQHHLTKKDYPRSYLERLIIMQKGSLERSKAQIENICAMRTLLPEYFEIKQDEQTAKLDGLSVGLLPTLTEDHYRVLGVKFTAQKGNTKTFFKTYKFIIRLTEYVMATDYCCGVLCILDYRDVDIMDYIAATNVKELYQFLKIITVGYALRLKYIHIITPSTAANTFINLVKKMVSNKIANRFYIHKTIEPLYEYVARDKLPSDFGGHGESLVDNHRKWVEALTSKKIMEHLKEMSEAKSTQANEMKDTISDPDLGISGSFRSLNVD
ncbi:alpha-tocopherol transfer protein-like [Manduca sexta]|uniref:CRAL-TRIO domain-containing protein n=1 Tax=Manduca sexta TaxID=7130 RepID=A0A922CT89_MANSE|nr:alpha-tocopherol transfer protein-like [Manduca sexta]KAG6457311.1 hypothetical protein O3G_MSEX010229 [Manduca sexta]KAG6457312.1 hypothetical protein O3G_MSEX010229 [Manduca sexta]